jgi:hypothetical protein
MGDDMSKLQIIPFGLVLLVLGSADASAGPCMPWVRWANHQTVDGYMTVRMGKPCHLNFRSAGPTERTAVLVRPSNGTLVLGSIGRLTYRSRAGFVGSDTFTYARRGFDARNNPMDATVRVSVKVTP